MTDIVVLMDGTTFGQDSPYPTNILKMHRLLSSETIRLYFRGIGNRFDNPGLFGLLRRLLSSAFGMGADAKRDEAYEAVSAVWRPGDRLFLFGFSRGAATVRMLAQRIHEDGIHGHFVDVTLLGCFDTVASFGIPGNHWNLFKDFHVAQNVERARHAVALDETRDMFPVTMMNQGPHVEEVWFKGDHSDVGGGHELTGLSDITLYWMINEAKNADLKFKTCWFYTIVEDPDQEPHSTEYWFTSSRTPGVLIDDRFYRGTHLRHTDSDG